MMTASVVQASLTVNIFASIRQVCKEIVDKGQVQQAGNWAAKESKLLGGFRTPW